MLLLSCRLFLNKFENNHTLLLLSRRTQTTTNVKPPSDVKPAAAHVKSINKVLVANRGDVAIRIFRACNEVGVKAVGVYSPEDNVLSHKLKADETYLIGVGKHPAEAYKDINEIVKVSLEAGVDAVHPGHGFLAERSDFAEAVIKAGLKYIGPSPEVLKVLGNKVEAKEVAKKLQIPVIPGTGVIKRLDEAQLFLKAVDVPILVKATYGSHGKGIRLIDHPKKLNDTIQETLNDAKTFFGDGSVYLEKFLTNVRHIEVQVMADTLGNVVHVFDRDGSIQWAYKKKLEIAPAPNLPEKTRDDLISASLQICRHLKYEDLGSFEFLVTPEGKYYFLEVNACLTPQHAATEEVTGIDLVQAQLKMAEGRSLIDYLHLKQENIRTNGYAIHCEITSEDPQKNFEPQVGHIDVFRQGAGAGIRMDGASGFSGAHATPYYDPVLLKLTAKAFSLKATCRKLHRTLKEFRVQGIQNNLSFLSKLMLDKSFQKGKITTNFLNEHPELFQYKKRHNRANLLINYCGDVMVNGPSTQFYTDRKPPMIKPLVPKIPANIPPPEGFRNLLKSKGAAAFIKAVKNNKDVLLSDTTFRDAHQSLLVTRVRTFDLLRIAPYVSHYLNNLFSIEMWGGASFEVAMNYLHECPWERLIELRKLIPNIPFQMLIRGASIVGYSNYPDNVVYKFCEMATKAGIDIFRVFDSLNYLPNMQMTIDAVHKAGGIVESALSYTGDIADPTKKKYTLQYYLDLAAKLASYGSDMICVKDTAGLLKPKAASLLVTALKEKLPDMPIHVHTHDTSGNGVATLLASTFAGADIIDVAADTMSGITSQPSMGAIIAAVQNTTRTTNIGLEQVSKYSAYWEQTRTLYAPFECTSTMKTGNSDVYFNEIPGHQYINLQFQAYSYGSGDHFEDIKKAFSEANELLGNIVKSSPTCYIVGDLAHFMVQNKLSAKDIADKADELPLPASVVHFFLGGYGEPYQGYPEPLRTKIVKGMKTYEARPGSSLTSFDFKKLEDELKTKYEKVSEYDIMSAALLPDVANNYFRFRAHYGPVDKLPTRIFLVGPQIGEEFTVNVGRGKTFMVTILAISSSAQGRRKVFYRLNGMLRLASIKDRKAGKAVVINPKAERGNKLHVGAPLRGTVLKINVKPGDVVEKRFPLAVLSAMKMDTTIFCPFPGMVKTVNVAVGSEVEIGDLIITLE
ncbi:pyruvate carboxylase 1-like [Onthophagus taurus]|uniref:pyruvate carboxylase 1-like n=1 Tax=Onthophagus taurus TaxID=166361 RepID=UPI000C206B91|nr:pyruvate carboxylase 1-like [Onthophagus taurus]